MILDLLRDTPGEADRADVLVIGAGAAGIVLALELARLGKTVTLVEGGGREVEDADQDTYRSEVAGQRHTGVHNGRFRALGGTTRRWGGQILELDALDFEAREWVPGSGWPFRKSELTRHYARALELEGVAAAIQGDAEVWKAVGEREPQFGRLEPYFTRWCPEPDFSVLHGKALESSERIRLWLHANAVELVMEGERATGVRCRTLDGSREAVFGGDEVVFCLGTIESIRFFLQPREGSLPWNRSGRLGRHFQDHIDLDAAAVRPLDPAQFHGVFDNVFLRGRKYHPKVHLRAEAQRQLGTLNVASTMDLQQSPEEKEGLHVSKQAAKKLMRGQIEQLGAGEVRTMLGRLPLMARQGWRLATRHRVMNPLSTAIRLRVQCEQEPLGLSSVTLGEQRDRLGLLRTRMDWRVSDAELATIRRYVEVAREELAELAELVPEPDLMAGDPEAWARVRSRVDDGTHHMGGMRMDADPARGVVSPELRLHGTRNVSVCSGAVFPTSGFSNPTHTVLALACRLAKRLAGK
jgi:choline dehydrogenase-like flavoprotein